MYEKGFVPWEGRGGRGQPADRAGGVGGGRGALYHLAAASAMASSTLNMAEAVLGMYLVRLRLRCWCSRAASWRAILA
jgi:hypothetical protein